MLEGCKLDPTLVSALVERWKSETHTFYLPCDECTITLEDVALQLGLPVDGSVVTGSTVIPGKKNLCESWAWWQLLFLRHQVNDPYTFPLVIRPSYVGLPEQLKDIWLLLDQHSKAEFEWMSYADPDIIECVPPKFLAIRSMWDAKDEIFTHSRTILLIGHNDLFGVMPWFRVTGKLYQLSIETRSKQLHRKRPRRLPQQCRFKKAPHYAPHYASPQHSASAPPVGTYFEALPSLACYALMPMQIPALLSSPILASMLTYLSFATSYDYSLIVSQAPTASLFYRCESSTQPPSRGVDTRWEARTTLHSSTEEDNGDKDEAEGGDEYEDQGRNKDEYEGRGKDEEDEHNDHDQEEEPTP
ncbi:hypothetical protein Gotur_013787 [Gossypium turneri]